MPQKHEITILFSVVLLIGLGCNPTLQLPKSQSTPTLTPQAALTLTPTSYVPHPLPEDTQTPTPTSTPHGLSYKAVGEGISYSGTICDLEKPFTLISKSQYNDFTVQFTPSSTEAGSFTIKGSLFGGAGGAGTTYIDGSGHYTVTSGGGKATQLILNVDNASAVNTAMGGGTGGGFQILIDLAEIKKCN